MKKIYKQFFIKTLSLMAFMPLFYLVFILLLAQCVAGSGIVKYGESQVINRWAKIKKEYARQLEGKNKLVFVSGSNTIFGLNTQDMENALGMPVLNYGLHGGLGSYVLFDVKRVLNKGDTVILALEYNYYIEPIASGEPTSTVIEYIISYDKEYYNTLNIKDKLMTANYLFKLKTLTAMAKEASAQFELNKNGDIIDAQGNDEGYIKVRRDEPLEYNVLFEKIEEKPLGEFVSWCRENEIKVYAIAPNIDHKKEITLKERKFFNEIKLLYKLLDVEFLGNFEDGFFDKEFIYNTKYHLNKEGQKLRTQKVLELVKKQIL